MRKKFKLYGSFIALTFGLFGCNLFDFHPYDGHIRGEREINAKNIEKIESQFKNNPNLRFAFIGDTQRQYDETRDFVNHINQRDDIDFVIHGGDITDFGLTEEFIKMRDIMNKLKVPYVALIGNHDLLANGEEVYEKIFGPSNFTFSAGQTKFICLNTNALEYDYSKPIPDLGFMQKQLLDTSSAYKRTIVAMHVQPKSQEFNTNIDQVFQHYINSYKNTLFCINAHNHNFSVRDLFNDGINYYTTTTIKHRAFMIFDIKEDNTYTHEQVYY